MPDSVAPPASVVGAPRRRWSGYALAATATLIWAGWFVVTRLAVTRELGIYDVTALRIGVGALVLLPAFLRSLPTLPRGAWRDGVVLSFCWGAPFVLLLSWGVRLSSAAHAAAITPTTMPVLAGLMSWAVFGERLGRRRWLSFAVIVAGVLALCLSAPAVGGHGYAWLGDAALLGGAALWAIYTLRVRRTGLTPLQSAALVCLYSSAAYLPVYAFSGASRLGAAPWPELLLQALYQGVLVSGVSIVAYNRAIALIGPGATASVTSLVPVAATLLAVLVLGEVPSPATAAAVACIAAGAYLAARSTRPAPT